MERCVVIFGSRKRIDELEAENANLRQWVEYLKGVDAVQLAEVVAKSRVEASELAAQVQAAQAELTAARLKIVETDEIALLQEIGIYQYRHPLDDAVAYRSQLKQTKDAIRTLAKSGAVQAAQGWMVNNSAKEGAKMTRDLSKLMLRAYNAEADNIVRTLRPHALRSAIARLDKTRETIAKLGAIVQIRITDEYHRWRVYELEITADYLMKVEEERERLREERARQREEEKAMRELEAEKRRLEKEQSHYATALEKLRQIGDKVAIADMEARLAQITSVIEGIENREANIRAGYVYVISNCGSFGEHIVKIGMTRRLEPMDRVRELGSERSHQIHVHSLSSRDDASRLRPSAPAVRSAGNLVNLRREYFYVTPREVSDALEQIGSQQLLEFREVPEATEWRASGGPTRAKQLTSDSVAGVPA